MDIEKPPFTVHKELATGASARVCLGRDRKGQAVAVKYFKRDKTGRQAFLRERAALRRIRHPNVIREVPSASHERNALSLPSSTLILEYAVNGDLLDLIIQVGGLPEDLARAIFHQVIDGVEACHASGIVHRDLKPENFLLADGFDVKICDFGFAALLPSAAAAATECRQRSNTRVSNTRIHPRMSPSCQSAAREDGEEGEPELGEDEEGENEAFWGMSDPSTMRTRVGTLGYMAPEVKRGEIKQDHRCDMWSLGVCLFIIITGFPPYLDMAPRRDFSLQCILTQQWRRFWMAKERHASFSDEFKEILPRLLEKDPSKRISFDALRKTKWMMGKMPSRDELAHKLQERLHQATTHQAAAS